MMNLLNATSMIGMLTAASGTEGWTIKNFLSNGAKVLNEWGSLLLVVLGVVALIVAAWQIVTGLISHGKKQISWAIVIILIVVGGIFVTVGGVGLAGGTFGLLAQGVGESVNQIGTQDNKGLDDGLSLSKKTIIPYLQMMIH